VKKLIIISVLASAVATPASASIFRRSETNFSGAFTAGYVFKRDHLFKEVYGLGAINIITADGCYTPFEYWGIGAKISYWFTPGDTTFFGRDTFLQEVPFTAYLRGILNMHCGLRLYASLGGGGIWAYEKSYLGKAHVLKPIGEAELGMNYCIYHRVNFTAAARYLFPREAVTCPPCVRKIDLGGFDIRAGIGFDV